MAYVRTRIAMDKYPGLVGGLRGVQSDLAGPIATNSSLAFGFPYQRSSEQILDLLVQVCSD